MYELHNNLESLRTKHTHIHTLVRSGTKANALSVKRRKRGNVDGPNTVGERFLYVMKAGHTYIRIRVVYGVYSNMPSQSSLFRRDRTTV